MMNNASKIVMRRLIFFLNPSAEILMYSKIQKQSPRGFLKNYMKFTGSTCVTVPFLMKLQVGLQLYQKKDQHSCSPANFAQFLRTPFLDHT